MSQKHNVVAEEILGVCAMRSKCYVVVLWADVSLKHHKFACNCSVNFILDTVNIFFFRGEDNKLKTELAPVLCSPPFLISKMIFDYLFFLVPPTARATAPAL
jgi:hypothetical protein